MAQKDSQDELLQFRTTEARLEGLIKHRDMVVSRLNEIEVTMNSIEQVAKSKDDVLFHVGGEAFMSAKPHSDGKVLVMIGAEIALEKTPEEARKLLTSRKAEAENVLKQVQKDVESLTADLERMAAHIEGGHGH